MARAKTPKIPKRIARVVERCQRGEVIVKTLRPGERGGSETCYVWHPSGTEAPAVTCAKAIQGGYLIPGNDGLFGAETSQTWRAP